jgi:hypothetical protein
MNIARMFLRKQVRTSAGGGTRGWIAGALLVPYYRRHAQEVHEPGGTEPPRALLALVAVLSTLAAAVQLVLFLGAIALIIYVVGAMFASL